MPVNKEIVLLFYAKQFSDAGKQRKMKESKKGIFYFTSNTEKEGYEPTPLFLIHDGETSPFVFFPSLGTPEGDIYNRFARPGAKEVLDPEYDDFEIKIIDRFGGLTQFAEWYSKAYEKNREDSHVESKNPYRFS